MRFRKNQVQKSAFGVVGLEVHNAKTAVAPADGSQRGEPRCHSAIENSLTAAKGPADRKIKNR